MFSSLVNITILSPYNSGKKKHTIDRLTIHCFVGQVSAKRGLEVFAVPGKGSNGVSSNYVVGYDGSIGGCVDENNRAWTSSSSANDNRAITIEVASDTKSPYRFNDAAYEATIALTVDICRRYGKRLVWIPQKLEALSYKPQPNEMIITLHKWFANKACPGAWFIEHIPDFVNRVNSQLSDVKENTCMVEVRVCKRGDVNETVKSLQGLLNLRGFCGKNGKPLTVDGDFGNNTAFAVCNFQKSVGLNADVVVGSKTWQAILN